ncbi:hypothetical protein [Flavobacterium phage FpV4]|uniref:Uncharacterized protein n=2 Tax=Fipvunavirus Fpv4 TaxID=2560476 RepID=A0A1B0WKT3_9CAUD|nr:hypothetical protein BOW80_gp17 [Flavobacterium phage Fpv3]YP_009594073.1 hypothetical protein FDG89_gp17 [Flavobacterium phage FpV4]ALN97130.1 hypothetical protein [Flavobacterium phage FpV4]ANB40419.1 hypothetical protein [Flavobacterium phage Fpv3]
MSNRNNDVFQVLVTKGNQAVLPVGQAVETLAVGQIGVFDANTNLSVATLPREAYFAAREFYFAVGVNRSGGRTLEDIKTSAGQLIQKKGIVNYSFVSHTAAQPMIVKVGDYKAECETDYAVKIEFRNSRIYRTQGFNQFSKTYAVKTSCCDCESGCGSGDANELTNLLVNEINMERDGLVLAKPIARQVVTAATHGTSVNYAIGAVMTIADVTALIAYNAVPANNATKVFTDISLTAVPLKLKQFCDINLGFHKFVETVLVVSLVDGFACTGKVTITQEIVFEEGTGNNIRQKEYHASGWNGAGPYPVSAVTGMSLGNINYDADVNGKYDQFILEYNQKSESGWLEYENTLSTIFAVPEADVTTRAGLATVLDALVDGGNFEALADDAALAGTNPLVVEPVVTDITKDGLA